jgi:hypothetical protein
MNLADEQYSRIGAILGYLDTARQWIDDGSAVRHGGESVDTNRGKQQHATSRPQASGARREEDRFWYFRRRWWAHKHKLCGWKFLIPYS